MEQAPVSTPARPPFTREGAKAMVRYCEESWNTCDAEIAGAGYTEDTRWRYRDQFLAGRPAILEFLRTRFKRAKNYRLKKSLGSFAGNVISARFVSEWQDAETGQCYRTFGNEHWEFDAEGKMYLQDISANDVKISEAERVL